MLSSLYRFFFGDSAEEAEDATLSATERVRRVERELERVEEQLLCFKRHRKDSVKHALEMREHVEALTMELQDYNVPPKSTEKVEFLSHQHDHLKHTLLSTTSELTWPAQDAEAKEGRKEPNHPCSLSDESTSHLFALWEALYQEERRILCQRDLLDVKEAKVEVQAHYLRAQLRTARDALREAASTFGAEAPISTVIPAVGLSEWPGDERCSNSTAIEMVEMVCNTTEVVVQSSSLEDDKYDESCE